LLDPENKYTPHVLSYYENEIAIDLLVEVLTRKKLPVSQNYGAVVCACNPSWAKLKEMIRSGRPASLIAIDALWLDSTGLKRIDVNRNELIELLEEYLKIDTAPRTRQAVEAVREKYNIQTT